VPSFTRVVDRGVTYCSSNASLPQLKESPRPHRGPGFGAHIFFTATSLFVSLVMQVNFGGLCDLLFIADQDDIPSITSSCIVCDGHY